MVTVAKSPMMEGGGREGREVQGKGRPRQHCALESARKKKVGLRQIPRGKSSDKKQVL